MAWPLVEELFCSFFKYGQCNRIRVFCRINICKKIDLDPIRIPRFRIFFSASLKETKKKNFFLDFEILRIRENKDFIEQIRLSVTSKLSAKEKLCAILNPLRGDASTL